MFDRDEVKNWRRRVHREIDRALGIGADDLLRPGTLVMITVAYFGTDIATLTEITGQTPQFVRSIVRRLRQQRILVGQRLRVNWEEKGFAGVVSLCCDALVLGGEVVRPVDPKRSAALKGKTGRKPGTKVTRRKATVVGAFTPQITAAPKQLYGLAKWEKSKGSV